MQLNKVFRFSVFSVIALITLFIIGNSIETSSAEKGTQAFSAQLSNSSDQGLSIKLTLPTQTENIDGVIHVDGLDARFSDPGSPDLPYYSTLIALPPEANATASVEFSGAIDSSVESIRPIPSVVINNETDILAINSLESQELLYTENADIYEAEAAFPAVNYHLSEPMYIRDLRVVRLSVYPVQYNPAKDTLTAFSEADITVTFSGGSRSAGEQLPGSADFSNILNGEDAENWRSLPSDFGRSTTNFPIGKDGIKITISEDGIYELTYADLQAAGMNVAAANPNNFEMMQAGEPVAYQFVGDGDNSFESGEKVLFYGWAFDNSRYEKLYIGENNVFWLFANGTPTKIASVANKTGTVASSWQSTIDFEEDKLYFTGRASLVGSEATKWTPANSENEADAWHWFGLRNYKGTNPENYVKNVTLDLPNPTASSTGNFLIEYTNTNEESNHKVDLTVDGTFLSSKVWGGNKNVNHTIDNVAVGSSVDVELFSNAETNNVPIDDDVLVNRISVTYDREFMAVDNNLQFIYDASGAQRFPVGGFSTTKANADFHAWDISDRYKPKSITLAAGDFSTAGGAKSVAFGVSDASEGVYIVSADVKSVAAGDLSSYTASSLEPSGNSAEWVAISHGDFKAEAEKLATYRASQSSLSTHVVDVEDVYNQYGYGLATPIAIKEFLTHAMDWGLEYAVLVGDATQNPRQIACTIENTLAYTKCPPEWTASESDYVVTDFQFKDRFIGLIASDHPFATLVGNDEIEDIAIGRIPVKTVTEMQSFNSKVIKFEAAIKSNAAYTNNFAWLADDLDNGGDFCLENSIIKDKYFDTLNVEPNVSHEIICLKDYFPDGVTDDVGTGAPESAKDSARIEFFNFINSESARIINYRGHGSVDDWAANLISVDDVPQFFNIDKPAVILSADCLDGNFFVSGEEALGESILQLDQNRGSVAHWSSSGLGFSAEHTILQDNFYSGLYNDGHTAIGDAIKYSKANFVTVGGNLSEVYSFILLGDPAMQLVASDSGPQRLYLPLLVKP